MTLSVDCHLSYRNLTKAGAEFSNLPGYELRCKGSSSKLENVKILDGIAKRYDKSNLLRGNVASIKLQ